MQRETQKTYISKWKKDTPLANGSHRSLPKDNSTPRNNRLRAWKMIP